MKRVMVVAMLFGLWLPVAARGQYAKPMTKALYWTCANREGAIDIIMKAGWMNQRPVAASLYDRMCDAYIPGLSAEGLYQRAELEFAVLKEKPNFKPEQFVDERFYTVALKTLAKEPAAKS